MKALRSLLLPLIALSLSVITPDTQKIIGTWTYHSYSEEGNTYKRLTALQTDAPGLEFQKDGVLIVRQNAGWCGTPPISYSNYQGTWKSTSDSTLTMTYPYWGGTIKESIQILEMTPHSMNMKVLKTQNIRRGETEE